MNKFRRLIQMLRPRRWPVAMFRGLRVTTAMIVTALAAISLTPSRVRASPVHRVVAVGDLHGDFIAWRAIAQTAGIVDPAGRWIGGKTVLVQLGDVVDRGPDSLRIINDLMRLQREAAATGGRVVAMVGNHEAMNMTDDLRYVTPEDFAAFADAHSPKLREEVYAANRAQIEAAYRKTDPKSTSETIKHAWIAATPLGKIEHQKAWHPEGRIGAWVAHNPAVVQIDDTVFVHGGLSAAYGAIPIAEINRRVSAALLARETEPASIINDDAGPLWYRGFAVPMAPGPEAELNGVLKAYDAKRLVIAHTPVLSGILTQYDGKLVRIDTGISAFYGGKLSYLEIIDGAALPHEVERPVTPR